MVINRDWQCWMHGWEWRPPEEDDATEGDAIHIAAYQMVKSHRFHFLTSQISIFTRISAIKSLDLNRFSLIEEVGDTEYWENRNDTWCRQAMLSRRWRQPGVRRRRPVRKWDVWMADGKTRRRGRSCGWARWTHKLWANRLVRCILRLTCKQHILLLG